MSNPHLFRIVTPICTTVLESLLVHHPNPDFVSSVLCSFSEGFWPWADTASTCLPFKLDAKEYLSDPAHIHFAEEQCQSEINKGRFSESFSTLLPCMLSIPATISTKNHSDKLQLCINHSAQPFPLNDLIDKKVVSVPLDGLQQFRQSLLNYCRIVGFNVPIVAFKSDAKDAHCLCPLAREWRSKQVVKINGSYNVDHCCNFGSRASGGIWGRFFSLVLWIAIALHEILDLFAYCDDVFSFELESNVLWYEPYQRFMPSKQACLLELWDEIGIPHDEAKQVSGPIITIISFDVDVNKMSFTMPPDARLDLILAIREFAIHNRRPKLSDLQQMASWINWSLNVFPLLQPCLSALYAKMSHKKKPSAELYLNTQICCKLLWAANHLESCEGVFLLKSLDWEATDANYFLLSDTCLFGLGFWSPHHGLGFQASVPTFTSCTIFYWEAYAVLSAFHWILHFTRPPPCHVVVYTDNSNTDNLFCTLRATPDLNPIVLTAADLMMHFDCQLRVIHIAGEQNDIADAISRYHNSHAVTLACMCNTNLYIKDFTPPQLMLGAVLS